MAKRMTNVQLLEQRAGLIRAVAELQNDLYRVKRERDQLKKERDAASDHAAMIRQQLTRIGVAIEALAAAEYPNDNLYSTTIVQGQPTEQPCRGLCTLRHLYSLAR